MKNLLIVMIPHRKSWISLILPALLFCLGDVRALQVTNYITVVNDRFSSSFATNPVANTNANFVGAGYDWSGVGWSATDGTRGFGFISPQHYLVATHYGGAANIRIQQNDGTLATGSQRGVTNTGLGVPLNSTTDLSLGTLNARIADPSQVARYAVLDLNSSSSANTTSAYVNQALYIYGRGPNGSSSPRIGLTTISSAISSGTNQYFTTPRTEVQLQTGDSGSPAFMVWTNVNGGQEVTMIGNNAAITDTSNFLNFLGAFQVMNALNTTMTQDGYALRVVGNSSNTWVGSSITSIGNRGAWGLNPPANAPTDRYVTFNGATAGNSRSVTVDSDANLRGLYFRSTTNSTLGFTFSGENTLTVGRGGIVNYDIARQTFVANLQLGDHQYWDGGVGGMTISNLNSNGKLLEVTGAGTNRLTGNMSGSGGLAVSGGKMEVTGTNSYTGRTWVHAGQLSVNGRIDSSAGVSVGTFGSLAGSGHVAAISGSGSIDPGNSPGIMTAPSVDPTGGLDFNFEFTGLNPVYADAFNSVNDLLRLTAATPFTASLGSINSVNIYFSFTSLNPGSIYTGGFFTDQVGDFLATIDQAAFSYHVLATGSGTVTYNGVNYDIYTGYDIEITTVEQTADFAGGTVNGRVTQFEVVPEPSTYALLAFGAGLFALVMWRRRPPQAIRD
jgi:hypothetical protein